MGKAASRAKGLLASVFLNLFESIFPSLAMTVNTQVALSKSSYPTTACQALNPWFIKEQLNSKVQMKNQWRESWRHRLG